MLPREEDDFVSMHCATTFTEEGSLVLGMFNSGYCSSSSEPKSVLYDVI